jgi:hypothetical protein
MTKCNRIGILVRIAVNTFDPRRHDHGAEVWMAFSAVVPTADLDQLKRSITMRTTSLLSIAALALVLAAPLASIATAGDHAGNQWREDNDNSQVSTTYVPAGPVANSSQSAVAVTK